MGSETGVGSEIGTLEWSQRLQEARISKATMNRLVMDYMIIEGHKEAAMRFMAESGTQTNVDLETISDRMAIREAVEAGDIASAIDRVNRLDPAVLAGNSRLLFRLHRQQLIELIRAEAIEEAIAFAQRELAPLVELDASLLDELEESMMLLAYSAGADSSYSHLLSVGQRQQTARELNVAILLAQQQEQQPKLLMMLRMLQWTQAELREQQQVAFPVMHDIVGAVAAGPPAVDASATSV